MISIKVNGIPYPARVSGKMVDTDWDRRSSKSITLEMDYYTAKSIFTDGLEWSIQETETVVLSSHTNENGEVVFETEERTEEYDNSEYCVAGSITDNRDGTMTIKMGKLTELEEAYEILLGGI